MSDHEATHPVGNHHELLVLIVEDEVLIAMDVKDCLGRNGHKVLGPAFTVENALSLLDATRPDIALLDFNIRGRDLTPVAQRLRDLSVPFVLMTSQMKFDAKTRNMIGRAENIGKPMIEQEMFGAMERALAAEGAY